MKLYERDYTVILTQEEKEAQQGYEKFMARPGIKNPRDNPLHSHPNWECRKFIWCHNSYFPNNCLYFAEPGKLDLSDESEKYKSALYTSKNENQIQTYIKGNRKWFIPGSIFKDYNFGHHDAYLFPELKLGAEYIVDYVLLGKSSDGYSLVLIEFENPDTPFAIAASNTESDSVRKGITQIRDWKIWIDNNRDYFFQSTGLNDKKIDVPISRIFYCLVVSRRDCMDKKATDLRSQLCYEMNNTKIISFDRLGDNICNLDRGY
jgi:hypothetical protein